MKSTNAISKHESVYDFKTGFGMEFIWQLEDSFEDKNAAKFLSFVSSNFRKNFSVLRRRVEKEFAQSENIKLYVRFKDKFYEKEIEKYVICWIKIIRKKNCNFPTKTHGSSVFVLKRNQYEWEHPYSLIDVEGKSPF